MQLTLAIEVLIVSISTFHRVIQGPCKFPSGISYGMHARPGLQCIMHLVDTTTLSGPAECYF